MSAGVRGVLVATLLTAACAGASDRRAAAAADTASAAPPPSSPSVASRAQSVPRPAEDSLRGIVERAGNEPDARLLVRAASGEACVLDAGVTASLEGLEVAFWGTRRAEAATMPGVTCALSAARFAVRGVEGIAAVDGVLRRENAEFVLELVGGERRRLREVPASLRAQLGARIYWAGPLDRAPAAYGVLAPPIT